MLAFDKQITVCQIGAGSTSGNILGNYLFVKYRPRRAGTGSLGARNLIQRLLRVEVRQRYWRGAAKKRNSNFQFDEQTHSFQWENSRYAKKYPNS